MMKHRTSWLDPLMDMLADIGDATNTGLTDALGSRYQAWLHRQKTTAQVSYLRDQTRLTCAQRDLVLAQLSARHAITKATVAVLEAERELQFHLQLMAASPKRQRKIAAREVQLTRQIETRRSLTTSPVQPAKAIPAKPAQRALQPMISAAEIETAATRAVIQASQLPPREAEQFWLNWQQAMEDRLPAYAAGEVKRKAMELRGLIK